MEHPQNETNQYVFTSNQLGLWDDQQQKSCDASKILISAQNLNNLVYIHLRDLTWATPRIFCWQDDRRSRSDLSSQGQVDSVQCLLQCQLRRWEQSIINYLVHGLIIAIIKDQYSHPNITLLSSRWIISAKDELPTNRDQLSQSNTRDSNDRSKIM